jgi:hypothetical protein
MGAPRTPVLLESSEMLPLLPAPTNPPLRAVNKPDRMPLALEYVEVEVLPALYQPITLALNRSPAITFNTTPGPIRLSPVALWYSTLTFLLLASA